MPLKHLRVCDSPCGRVRFAPCGRACALPVDTYPDNWRVNLQEGAGTIGRPPELKVTVYDANYRPLDVDLANVTLRTVP